jgi:hypothetical protein
VGIPHREILAKMAEINPYPKRISNSTPQLDFGEASKVTNVKVVDYVLRLHSYCKSRTRTTV